MSKSGWCSKHGMSFVTIKYRNGAKLAPCCPTCLHKVTGCNESLIAAQKQTLARQREELADNRLQIKDLQVSNKQLQDDYDRETSRLQQEVTRVNQVIAGNFWSWQGDAEADLAALTCPVIVDPSTLQQWLQQLNGAYGLGELADREPPDSQQPLRDCRKRLARLAKLTSLATVILPPAVEKVVEAAHDAAVNSGETKEALAELKEISDWDALMQKAYREAEASTLFLASTEDSIES